MLRNGGVVTASIEAPFRVIRKSKAEASVACGADIFHPDSAEGAAKDTDRDVMGGARVAQLSDLSAVLFPRPLGRQDTATEIDAIKLHSIKVSETVTKQIRSVAVTNEIKTGERVFCKLPAVYAWNQRT